MVPELIEQGALESATRQKVFWPVLRTNRNFFDMTGPGNAINVPQADTLTMAALTEAGGNTNEVWDPTDRQLLPVPLGTQLRITWMGRTYPQTDPMTVIVDEIANAWATMEDSAATVSFAALYTEAPSSGPDHEIGTNAVLLDATIARQIFSLLITAGARGPYNWFIDPTQWGELMQDSLALSLLKESGSQPSGFMAVEGVRMDMFVGKLFGVNIWCVPTGLITATGEHSIAVGQNAVGKAIKKMSTPLSPTPSELNVDIDWNALDRVYEVGITVVQDVGGIAFTSTTNKWMVDAVS